MATVQQLLEKLNTKGATVSTADLATELNSTKETVLKQLTREKVKGNIDGNSEEGWLITDAGKKALAKGVIEVTMIGEGITPREKFESIGRLIGITEDRITLAADIVWSGDYTDVIWVYNALGQADIRDDLRKVWVNSWRSFLQKGIPLELEAVLTGAAATKTGEAGTSELTGKTSGKDYIIAEDTPVRVGLNLGDFSLQDAKDILAIRALKSRFAGASGAGAGGTASGAVGQDKLSDIITALQPYLQKGTDINTLKEALGDKLALLKLDIMSHIPQLGGPAQPKSFIEQITELVTGLGNLKQAGPILRSILGIPESSGSPLSGVPTQVIGLDGKPAVLDLSQAIDLRKFLAEEKRADERHGALMGLTQTIRENVPDGVQALIRATEEERAKRTGTQKQEAAPAPQAYECGSCKTQFTLPTTEGWTNLKCPNPACGKVWTREEVMKV